MAMDGLLDVCTPPNWSQMSNAECKLYELSEYSTEYNSVVNKINKTLDVSIASVVRVQNPFLWGCYQLKKLEYKSKGILVKELEMFHCTAEDNIDSIACDNLDWRRCTRTKFGKGVSFSPQAEYANTYANFNIGDERALILAKLLVGRKIIGQRNMIIPPALFDTSVGNSINGAYMVYVKYCDFEFYPTHVAYYTY